MPQQPRDGKPTKVQDDGHDNGVSRHRVGWLHHLNMGLVLLIIVVAAFNMVAALLAR